MKLGIVVLVSILVIGITSCGSDNECDSPSTRIIEAEKTSSPFREVDKIFVSEIGLRKRWENQTTGESGTYRVFGPYVECAFIFICLTFRDYKANIPIVPGLNIINTYSADGDGSCEYRDTQYRLTLILL
jgi:hypothetical protein